MDRDKIEKAVKEIIIGVGEDPGRQGLVKTPTRVRRAYEELLSGYGIDVNKVLNGALYEVDNNDMLTSQMEK